MTVKELIDRLLADNENLLNTVFQQQEADPYTVCSVMLQVVSNPDTDLAKRIQLRMILDVILQQSLKDVTRETFRKQLNAAMRTRLERLHRHPRARELLRL